MDWIVGQLATCTIKGGSDEGVPAAALMVKSVSSL